MKLPRSLTTVTHLSKIIALALFIILPFVGFALGLQYQHLLNQAEVTTPANQPTPTPSDDEENMSFSGILLHFERPAPDINYDYQLVLDKPYIDNNNASGMTLTLDKIIVVPSNASIQAQMDQSLNKSVVLEGVWKWGYSESKYFNVIAIE